MSIKVIVSNKSAMEALYGNKTADVTAALDRLIEADKGRDIQTLVVYLDDSGEMNRLNAPPVTDPANENQVKKAVDAVYNSITPDYLVLLGSPDIVPHQLLNNPTRRDGDRNVPSDLPYASESSFSRTISRFVNPSRVVGRLAGITGNNDPAVLVKAIETSINLETRSADEYKRYFAVSCDEWEGSTAQSITHIAGNSDDLNLAPPKGPGWSNEQLSARLHFVNCHGANDDPNWYGQKGNNYPIAVQAQQINGKLAAGTIAAAECCYGGQLYDPAGVGGQAGLCNAYVDSGASAFCGSTNIAYGPVDGQGAADLVTQYFLQGIVQGSSAGRALLEARQKFLQESSPLNPVDQKTLAQFILLGDPSNHPVFSAEPVITSLLSLGPKSFVSTYQRAERRRRMASLGKSLAAATGFAKKAPQLTPKGTILSDIEKIVKNIGLFDTVWETFQVTGGALFKKAMAPMGAPECFHLVYGKQQTTGGPVPASAILIVKEQGGQLISANTVHRK
jgi:hypothetical protein